MNPAKLIDLGSRLRKAGGRASQINDDALGCTLLGLGGRVQEIGTWLEMGLPLPETAETLLRELGEALREET